MLCDCSQGLPKSCIVTKGPRTSEMEFMHLAGACSWRSSSSHGGWGARSMSAAPQGDASQGSGVSGVGRVEAPAGPGGTLWALSAPWKAVTQGHAGRPEHGDGAMERG